jgi:hypothetical protein
MEVEASWEWVTIESKPHSVMVLSSEVPRHRQLKIATYRELTHYTLDVTPRKLTTQSTIDKVPLLCFEKQELSGCARSLIHFLCRNGVPETRSFNFVREVREAIATKKRERDGTHIYESQGKIPRSLQLTISLWQPLDHGHFEPITWESQRHSILKRCYVAPFACSLFRDHQKLAAGLLMDTTWKILRCYVASILTVVIGNVDVSIALSFGPVEDVALYDALYATFRSLFNIDLSTCLIEFDQGPALQAICKKYQNPGLAFLRHLLVALGPGPFASEIGNFVRSRCDDDFGRLKNLYENLFSTVEDRILLNRALGKVGLCFKDGRINIENRERCQEVSMKERIMTRMPATTNSLKSSPGHLNAQTPRRNHILEVHSSGCGSDVDEINDLMVMRSAQLRGSGPRIGHTGGKAR